MSMDQHDIDRLGAQIALSAAKSNPQGNPMNNNELVADLQHAASTLRTMNIVSGSVALAIAQSIDKAIAALSQASPVDGMVMLSLNDAKMLHLNIVDQVLKGSDPINMNRLASSNNALSRAIAKAKAPEALQQSRSVGELTVWYGAMPESNGKSNFTAILHRKGAIHEGHTIDRSEYPDRVRYEADRVRYLLGELTKRPDILAYDANKHSGYTAPQPATTQAVGVEPYFQLSLSERNAVLAALRGMNAILEGEHNKDWADFHQADFDNLQEALALLDIQRVAP